MVGLEGTQRNQCISHRGGWHGLLPVRLQGPTTSPQGVAKGFNPASAQQLWPSGHRRALAAGTTGASGLWPPPYSFSQQGNFVSTPPWLPPAQASPLPLALLLWLGVSYAPGFSLHSCPCPPALPCHQDTRCDTSAFPLPLRKLEVSSPRVRGVSSSSRS